MADKTQCNYHIETILETNTDPLQQQFNNDLSMFPLDETKLS